MLQRPEQRQQLQQQIEPYPDVNIILFLFRHQAAAEGTVTYYTLFIIMFLVMGVLCGVLTSLETSLEEDDAIGAGGGGVDAGSNGSSSSANSVAKGQRHFNRAMAMRSIRLGIQPRLMKMRRSN